MHQETSTQKTHPNRTPDPCKICTLSSQSCGITPLLTISFCAALNHTPCRSGNASASRSRLSSRVWRLADDDDDDDDDDNGAGGSVGDDKATNSAQSSRMRQRNSRRGVQLEIVERCLSLVGWRGDRADTAVASGEDEDGDENENENDEGEDGCVRWG